MSLLLKQRRVNPPRMESPEVNRQLMAALTEASFEMNPRMQQNHARMIVALTDPLLGVSAESSAKFKESMEKPGVAFALYSRLKEKDLREFDPEEIGKMPANVIETLHKHFPTVSTIQHHRGTQICTVESNTCQFSYKGRSLHDERVLTLHEVGEQGLKLFVDNCIEIVHPVLYRKMTAVFLKAERGITKIDLCDLFDWCKCSVLDGRSKNSHGVVTFSYMQTPFGRVFVSVQVLKNASLVKVDLLTGDNTVQIQVKGVQPTVIGVGLYTSNYCKRCRKYGSDTVKLKECSRCAVLGVRLFYCSRECQLLDYPNHRQVCSYDWSSSDWRDTAPSISI
jgi:hypothetical protein